MTLINETVTLKNGYFMPKLGFGTHGIDSADAFKIITDALNVGYRHFETAPIYLNEKEIAKAFKAASIPRESLFITSKIPPHIKTSDGVNRVVKRIMKNLDVDYLDCLLINAPTPWGKEDEDFSNENIEVYKAMEQLYKDEIIGSIGLSNFRIQDIDALLPHIDITPHVHQIGVFIGHTLDAIVDYSKTNGMVIQGHSPLARGRILNNDLVNDYARKETITPARLAIRYVIEKGVYPVTKASDLKRMKDNINVDSPLQPETIQALDNFNKDVRDYLPPKAKWVL